jgi:hypothetical protein
VKDNGEGEPLAEGKVRIRLDYNDEVIEVKPYILRWSQVSYIFIIYTIFSIFDKGAIDKWTKDYVF